MAEMEQGKEVTMMAAGSTGKEGQGNDIRAAATLTTLGHKVVSSSTNIESTETGEDQKAKAAKKPDQSSEDEEDLDFDIPQRFTKSGRKRATPFPVKLMKVLANKEYHGVLSWTPSGKAFAIHSATRFAEEIMPKHFKSAKYSSFTRKLHRWGFMRHYRGEDAGCFYHKDFQKGRLDLVDKMTCYRPSSDSAKATAKQAAQKQQQHPEEPMSGHPHLGDMAGLRGYPMDDAAALRALGSPMAAAGMRPSGMMGYDMYSDSAAAALEAEMLRSMPNANRTGNLDMAIELEVSRRMEQRMNAMAYQRQAMELLQERNRLQALSRFQNPGASPSSLSPGYLNRTAMAMSTGMTQQPRQHPDLFEEQGQQQKGRKGSMGNRSI